MKFGKAKPQWQKAKQWFSEAGTGVRIMTTNARKGTFWSAKNILYTDLNVFIQGHIFANIMKLYVCIGEFYCMHFIVQGSEFYTMFDLLQRHKHNPLCLQSWVIWHSISGSLDWIKNSRI